MSTAVIVAGGKSRRFGSNKSFHEIGGRPMIRIVADILLTIFDEVIVAGGDKSRLDQFGLNVFSDRVPNRGVLGGIHNGLIHTEEDSIFFCGCDMPLLNTDVIRAVLQNVGAEDALVPVVDDKRQPLHAVYSRSILPNVERLLCCEGYFLPDLWQYVKVKFLDEAAFAKIDNYHLSFISFNDLSTVDKHRHLLPSDQ